MDPSSINANGFQFIFPSQNSQTISLDSSEPPLIVSQTSGPPRNSSQSSEPSKERRKWTEKEDSVLISAWLNTSKDPIASNEQKGGTFWRRIEEYFNGSPQLSGNGPRDSNSCKQRWGKINEQVSKFVGSFEAASKERSSGQSENDLMKSAHEIFTNDYGSKFAMDHAWRRLRFQQKWCDYKDAPKDKRKVVGDGASEEVISEPRPPGVKAAKSAKRKKHGPAA